VSEHVAAIRAAHSPARFKGFDLVAEYADTVRRVALTPVAFFRQAAPTRRATPAVPFAIASIGIAAGLGQSLAVARGELWGDQLLPVTGYFMILNGLALGVGAVLLHLLVRLAVRRHAGFRVTLGVLAYSQVGVLVTWLPPPVSLISPLVALWVSIVGVRERHATTTVRAAVVVLLASAMLAILSMMVVLVGLYFGRACCGVAGG